MNILYFANHITNSGGMERIMADKLNHLSAHGHNIALAYFGTPGDKPFFPLDPSVRLLPINAFIDTSSIAAKGRLALKLVGEVKRIIDAQRPDVVVSFNAKVVSWILPFVRRSIPKVIELHFSFQGIMTMNGEIYGGSRLKPWLHNTMRRTVYPLYSRCVFLTNDDKAAWGFKNGMAIPNFTSLRPKAVSAMESKAAVCVARLEYPKNVDILVEAWSRVRQELPQWRLDIWGDGADRETLESLIASNGLQDVVALRGLSQSLASEYPKYSLFVLPSRYEGFPLVLVEAMQCGLPCIGFSISGNTTVIDNGKNGVLVNKRTADDLAGAIVSTINSGNLKRMSENALRSVDRYDKDKVMKMWTDLFEELSQRP